MVINFAIIQIVPGGPVEQMIAEMTVTAVESTARFSGSDQSESLANFETSANNDTKYRGAQGLDPDIIKEIEVIDEKEALSKYGSSDSGASLGDILGSILKKKD